MPFFILFYITITISFSLDQKSEDQKPNNFSPPLYSTSSPCLSQPIKEIREVRPLSPNASKTLNQQFIIQCIDNIEITHKLITYIYGTKQNSNKPRVFALYEETGLLIWEMLYKGVPIAFDFEEHNLIIFYENSELYVDSVSGEIQNNVKISFSKRRRASTP